MNSEYIISSDIVYIPYYNQSEDCEDHYTLNLTVKVPDDIYLKILGKDKYFNDTHKKDTVEFLKK